MLTCKQVSKALAETDYQELPFFKRMMLRLHVTICVICKKYNSDVMLFQDMARAFRHYEESDTSNPASLAAKAKWSSTIQSAAADDES